MAAIRLLIAYFQPLFLGNFLVNTSQVDQISFFQIILGRKLSNQCTGQGYQLNFLTQQSKIMRVCTFATLRLLDGTTTKGVQTDDPTRFGTTNGPLTVVMYSSSLANHNVRIQKLAHCESELIWVSILFLRSFLSHHYTEVTHECTGFALFAVCKLLGCHIVFGKQIEMCNSGLVL